MSLTWYPFNREHPPTSGVNEYLLVRLLDGSLCLCEAVPAWHGETVFKIAQTNWCMDLSTITHWASIHSPLDVLDRRQ